MPSKQKKTTDKETKQSEHQLNKDQELKEKLATSINDEIQNDSSSEEAQSDVSEHDTSGKTKKKINIARLKSMESRMIKAHDKFFKSFNEYIETQSQLYEQLDSKKKHNKSKPTSPSGFNKPQKVPSQVCKLLDLQEDVELTRPQVTKEFHNYCNKKHLKKEDDKRFIIPNKEMRKTFGLDDNVSEIKFSDVQTIIAKAYKEL